MIFKKLHQKILYYVEILQHYANRFWYPYFIGFLAAVDNFVIVIPNDGILISSSMLTPKKWFLLALCVAVGSTLGAAVLAALVEFQGLPWVHHFYPNIVQTNAWSLSQDLFNKYGLLLLFIVAVTPVMQQPAVILAGLANTPMMKIMLVIFIGRFIKFLIMAYLGSHAPRLLNKMWGLKDELKSVGINIKEKE